MKSSLIALLLLGLLPGAAWQDQTPTAPPVVEAPKGENPAAIKPLITTQQGAIPIILSVPHGGVKAIPGVPRRTLGVLQSDANTRELARAVARRIEEKTGKKPYIVMAEFVRNNADANRKESEALESPLAAPHYRAYHDALRKDVDEVRKKWPSGAILLDIHGQVRYPKAAVRGTQNGKTVKRLIEKYGQDAFSGPRSLFGAIEKNGYEIVPKPGDADQSEAKGYNGGFIVGTYGSHQANGIDAIQIESGNLLRRNKEAREKYAKALGDAIVTFYQAYVQPTESKPAS